MIIVELYKKSILTSDEAVRYYSIRYIDDMLIVEDEESLSQFATFSLHTYVGIACDVICLQPRNVNRRMIT